VFSLIYSSVAITGLNQEELDLLLGTSRRHNQEDDLTGLLLHLFPPEDGTAFFVQMLEGREEAVENTFRRIERDELHGQLVVLERTEIETRSFADWSMRLAEISTAELSRAADAVPVEELVRDPAAMRGLIRGYA
jgi:hypothetical protein